MQILKLHTRPTEWESAIYQDPRVMACMSNLSKHWTGESQREGSDMAISCAPSERVPFHEPPWHLPRGIYPTPSWLPIYLAIFPRACGQLGDEICLSHHWEAVEYDGEAHQLWNKTAGIRYRTLNSASVVWPEFLGEDKWLRADSWCPLKNNLPHVQGHIGFCHRGQVKRRTAF